MAVGLAIRREFLAQRSDPERLWVRYSPKGWPIVSGLSTDLAASPDPRRSRRTDRDPVLQEPAELRALDDLLWLPPVEPSDRARRDRWVASAIVAGVPVLVQRLPGERVEAQTGVIPILDLFGTLVSGEFGELEPPAEPGLAIWPLVAGWTDRPSFVSEGLAALRERGFLTVVGVRVELAPAQLRELADLVPPEGYERLFHAPPSDRRAFGRAVEVAGLCPFFERPLPGEPPILRRNRRLAGGLYRAGELWLAVDRDEVIGQAFFRAARWVDESSKDIQALALEGNLGIVDWIESPVEEVIVGLSGEDGAPLLQELREEYLSEVGSE